MKIPELVEPQSGWTPTAVRAEFEANRVHGLVRWEAPEESVVAAAQEAGRTCVVVDSSSDPTKTGLLKAAKRALRLPSYMGSNWDAFEECLGDVDPGAGLVVLWDGWTPMARSNPDAFATATAIWSSVASQWGQSSAVVLG